MILESSSAAASSSNPNLFMLNPPQISVEPVGSEFVLMATSYGRTDVAGPRILRAPPHPDIAWRHSDETQAAADANKLQQYLDGVTKAPSRTKIRQAGD